MLFRRKKKEYPAPQAPDNCCIYAIGDIHGRLSLLSQLHEKILYDFSQRQSEFLKIIYLGDYVDRGHHSKAVLDLLIQAPLEDAECVYIRGNHEQTLLNYLEDYRIGEQWFMWGGDATVRSYGVRFHETNGKSRPAEVIHQEFMGALPLEHHNFLDKTILCYHAGDYCFVHAGLRPGIALEQQLPEDMLMIRNEFVYSPERFEPTIVFGHTVTEEPYHENGRISVDTGAYATGVLTAAVLEGGEVSFIST